MEYRNIGTSGIKVSAISLGAWLTYGSDVVADDASEACLRKAIEHGVNYIDVADMYSYGEGEKLVGRIAKDYKRSDLVIATKAYWPMSEDVNDRGLSRKHIMESVHKSLKRFDMEYIDLFFCHRYDDDVPTEETIRAIEDLINQGKIFYWGTSMWNATQLMEGTLIAQNINANRPIVEQPRYNMLERDFVEPWLQHTCAELGMGLVVWSPLAQGILTGKYNDGIPEDSRYNSIEWFRNYATEEKLEQTRQLTKIADDLGVTMSALAIAWTLKNPVVASAITGATRPSHVEQNLKALDVEITDEINERIEAVLQNKPDMPTYN